jgi:hypothetical protein
VYSDCEVFGHPQTPCLCVAINENAHDHYQ